MKKTLACVLSSLPWLLSACGGSAVETSGTSQGGAATIGGTGGTSSTGGSLIVSGGGSAGSAQGGTSSGGGAAFGGSASGSAGATAGAGGCAGFECFPGNGACAGGYHFGVAAGQCCPSCVLDTSSDCAQGRLNYQEYVQSEVGQNSFCQNDSDCVIAAEPTACVMTCGVAIATAARASVTAALTSFAANNCSACPVTTTPGPQCPPFKAVCRDGACALSPPSN